MEIQERILDLNRVKVQLLISWLSHQDLVALINGCDQVVEDYILDNISVSGRKILLQGLNYTEEEFQQRKVARLALNKIYNEMMGNREEALKGSERRALHEKAFEQLDQELKDIYYTRFNEKVTDLAPGLERELAGYLDKLEKGQGL